MANKKPNKKFKQRLRCNLNDDEKITRGRELAEATKELERLEEDLGSIKAEFKSKTAAQTALQTVLSNTVTSGYEFREVECGVYLCPTRH